MPTRAIQFLKNKGISFEIVKYRHGEKGAAYAAQAAGYPLERVVKTLVVNLDNHQFCLALMPGNKQLSLKHIAKAFSVKKATLADASAAQRLTGYLVGGISPFGSKQGLPAAIDDSLLQHGSVIINGGQRGLMLKIQVNEIVKVLGCRVCRLAQE